MTNERAIEIIKTEWKCVDRNDGIHCDRKCENCDLVLDVMEIREAYNMAIRVLENEQSDRVSKSVFDQIKWERDIAIAQLEDLGYELGEKPRTDGDLISRQDLLKELEKWDWQDAYLPIHFSELVADLPSAEKTAEWIKQKSGDELFPEEIVCSKCYHSNSHLDFDEHNNPIGKVFLESKYCPNCGARMKGDTK